jgi:hypothetical protein
LQSEAAPVAHPEEGPDMTSSSKLRRFGLLLTLILSAVAVMKLGCGGSGKPGTTNSASTRRSRIALNVHDAEPQSRR